MEAVEVDQLVNKIQEIRKKNNVNWMEILKLALKNSPKDARKILSSIIHHDKQTTQELESVLYLDIPQKEDADFIFEKDFLRWLFIISYRNKKLFDTVMDFIQPWHFSNALTMKVYLTVYNLWLAKEPYDILSVSMQFKHEESAIFIELMKIKTNLRKAEQSLIDTANRICIRDWQRKIESVKLKIQSGDYTEERGLELCKEFEELRYNKPPCLENNCYE